MTTAVRRMAGLPNMDADGGLPWKEPGLWDGLGLVVPIRTSEGAGKYHIRIQRRPRYCDRGDWMIYVDGEGHHDLDFADGFPRYFFGTIDEVKTQMETWLNRREAFRAALR